MFYGRVCQCVSLLREPSLCFCLVSFSSDRRSLTIHLLLPTAIEDSSVILIVIADSDALKLELPTEDLSVFLPVRCVEGILSLHLDSVKVYCRSTLVYGT